MASRILHLAVADKIKEHLLYQEQDALYFGYYLHLIQDLIFRRLMYEDYHWNPVPDGNVLRLHNDYHLINRYVIDKYV